MFFRVRNSLLSQAGFLILVSVLAAVAYWYFRYLPLLRFNFHLGILALFAALGTFLLLLPFFLIGLRFPRSGLAASLRVERKAILTQDFATRFGSAVAAGAGEEFLLRGLIFGLMMDHSLMLAWILTVALSMLGYLRSRTDWFRLLLRAVEASCYAYLFFQHRSVFLIGSARFLQELIWSLALTTPWALYILEQKRFSWRNFYGAFRASQPAL